MMLRYQHVYSWPSLATPSNRPSLSADPRGYIPYRHRAVAWRFELDVLLLLVHVKGSTGVHHLLARPYFSNSETLLHSLERAAAGIGLHVKAHKTEFMCFNQRGDISTLNGSILKLVDKFTSSVSSIETDIDTRPVKAWTAIDRLSVIWKSDLTDEIKRSFFQAAIVSILLYGCTTWMLIKRMEKKLDSNYTRILRAILNKSRR